YLPLPDRFEINEYRIMQRFCLSVEDDDMRDDLCDAIRGRGAFRRFKDRVHPYGMAEEWYRYRDNALREMAMAWCEAHGLRYTETKWSIFTRTMAISIHRRSRHGRTSRRQSRVSHGRGFRDWAS